MTSLSPLQSSAKLSALKYDPWPGDRPPVPNMKLLEQKMDASWGRGKYRAEVWEDCANPINDWWLAYTPSPEEVEAAAQGFWFSDVEGWCKVNV